MSSSQLSVSIQIYDIPQRLARDRQVTQILSYKYITTTESNKLNKLKYST